jgi:hypothetical protein
VIDLLAAIPPSSSVLGIIVVAPAITPWRDRRRLVIGSLSAAGEQGARTMTA